MSDTAAKDNLTGIGLMLIAMLGFAFEDAIIKKLAEDMPVGQILIVLGVGGTAVFLTIALLKGERFPKSQVFHKAVLARTGFELFGTVFFTTSLALVPLSLISALIQVNPLMVILGAALFLGETVGIRRWTAVGVGLLGVFIILRPGFSGFEPAAIFTILGVIGLSGRDVVTRRVPKTTSSYVLSTLGFGAVIPAGLILLSISGGWTTPTPFMWVLLILSVVIGVTAYYAITAAMRVGEVSAISPFRYSRLIFGVAVGMAIFGETIDRWTVMGAVLIVASGLYSLWREAQLR